eukprot:Skav225912  [mRNA]  locus=scaffold1500:111967:114346:- [translate_table: standard]
MAVKEKTRRVSRFAHLGILHSNVPHAGEEQVSKALSLRRPLLPSLLLAMPPPAGHGTDSAIPPRDPAAARQVFNALVMAADVQRSGGCSADGTPLVT